MPNRVAREEVGRSHGKDFVDRNAFGFRRVIMLCTRGRYTEARSPDDGFGVCADKDAGTTNTATTVRWSAMCNVVSCSEYVACEFKM